MKFEVEYFKQILIDNSDKAMIQYVSIIMFSLKDIRQKHIELQPWFLIRTVSQLTAILKDKGQSPITKFKTTKLIMYLLLMNQPFLYEHFQNQLFSILKNDCHYNKSQRIQDRGLDFYKRNKFFDLANFQERQKIKIMGSKFIIFCLQIVYTLAKWIPLSAENRQLPSTFGKAYQQLLQQGITFPDEQDFIFFNEQRIIQIDKNIKKIEKDIQQKKFLIKNTKYAKYSNKDSQFQQTNSKDPEWLKNKLSEKDSLISEFRNNLDQVKQEKQLLIAHFESQKKKYQQKLRSYQKSIQQLSYKIKRLKKRLKKHQNTSDLYEESEDLLMSNTSEVSQIMDLKDKIKFLIKQNQNLRKQNQQNISRLKSYQQNQSKMSKQLNVGARKKINILNQDKILLAQQLLKQCKQNKEFVPTKFRNQTKNISNKNIENMTERREFYGIKKDQEQFQPFYSALKDEQRIRLRKSLLKSKQILHKDSIIQVGVKTRLINQITISLQLIITNISSTNAKYQNYLRNFRVEYVNRNKQVSIKIQRQKTIKGKHNLQIFQANEQYRQILEIQINNIDFKSLLLKIDYLTEQKQKNKNSVQLQQPDKRSIGLILPISKIKLLQFLPLTSKPKTIQNTPLTKLIQFNKKVASGLSKLRQYLQGKIDSIKKQLNITEVNSEIDLKSNKSQNTVKLNSPSKTPSHMFQELNSFQIKCKLLGALFFVQFGKVDNMIKVSIYHEKCFLLAQKLSEEIVFILQK